MNIKQAQYMLAVFETGSITNAAKELYISQSSLSQMLKQIEDEIGVEIFNRQVKPIVPTYAGQIYLDTARQMLQLHDALSERLGDIRQESRGKLKIGISRQRGMLFLPLILPVFFEKFPLVEIELEEQGSVTLEKLVLNGNINLAFVTTGSRNNNLEYRLIENETLVLLAGEKSKISENLESGTPINIRDVQNERFVSVKTGHSIRTLQDSLFQENNISPKILLETSNLETAIRVTENCNAVTLCPDVYLLRSLVPRRYGTFFPIKENTHHHHFYLCYRKDIYRPRYMQDMIEIACSCQLPRHTSLQSSSKA